MSVRPVPLIVAGLVLWGLFHAAGAYLFNHHPGRAAMVAGCVTAFLLFWWVMLASRRRRLAREADKE